MWGQVIPTIVYGYKVERYSKDFESTYSYPVIYEFKKN